MVQEPDAALHYADTSLAMQKIGQAGIEKAIKRAWDKGIPVAHLNLETNEIEYVLHGKVIGTKSPYMEMIRERFGPDHPALADE